jgi:hypothetical protein
MTATRPGARLLEAAERAGAKVVAIGDPGQLASVQAGGWLGAVGRALGAQRLTEVMRQRDPQERRALGALHDGQPERWLEWAGQAGRIETYSDLAGACGQALAEWARKAGESGLARTVMIARDSDTRERLNRGARELRREGGALRETCSYGTVEVAVGDRVICRRNDGPLDVDNGMRGTVRHVDAERVVIDTDGGLVRELSAAYVAEHVEHAYALTGHGMQGGTVEAAVVVASPRDLTAGWSYTALSRARGETRLLIHDEQFSRERDEFAPEDQTPATRDYLLARTGRRMVERDDEDLAIEQLPGAEREPSAGRADDPRPRRHNDARGGPAGASSRPRGAATTGRAERGAPAGTGGEQGTVTGATRGAADQATSAHRRPRRAHPHPLQSACAARRTTRRPAGAAKAPGPRAGPKRRRAANCLSRLGADSAPLCSAAPRYPYGRSSVDAPADLSTSGPPPSALTYAAPQCAPG